MAATSARQGKRRGLTREQILQAAIVYADANGVEQLSMRQLAAELGCGVMSLYNHVADKEDLIAGMVDAVAGLIELPQELPREKAGSDDWSESLRRCCKSAYRTMLRHPWAPKVWGQGNGLAKNDYHEAILRVLRQAGFTEELSCRGFHALTMHVVGFSMQVLELRPLMDTKEKVHALGSRTLDVLPEERFPYMREHIRFHMSGLDRRNDFEFMLEMILAGLEHDHAQLEKS